MVTEQKLEIHIFLLQPIKNKYFDKYLFILFSQPISMMFHFFFFFSFLEMKFLHWFLMGPQDVIGLSWVPKWAQVEFQLSPRIFLYLSISLFCTGPLFRTISEQHQPIHTWAPFSGPKLYLYLLKKQGG